MKNALIAVVVAMAVSPAFAAGSGTSTGVTNNGASFIGTAQSQLGNRTITLNIGGGAAPSISSVKGGAGAGTTANSMSVGLSIGATLGGGFGSTGGMSSSQAGALNNLAKF